MHGRPSANEPRGYEGFAYSLCNMLRQATPVSYPYSLRDILRQASLRQASLRQASYLDSSHLRLFMCPEGLFPFSVLRHCLELNLSYFCALTARLVVVADIALVHHDHIDSCTEDPPQMGHAEIFHIRPVTVAKKPLLATHPARTIGRVVPAPNTPLRQSVAMVEVVDELYGAKRLRTDCAHIHTVHPTHKLIHLALNTQQHSARRLELRLTTSHNLHSA